MPTSIKKQRRKDRRLEKQLTEIIHDLIKTDIEASEYSGKPIDELLKIENQNGR